MLNKAWVLAVVLFLVLSGAAAAATIFGPASVLPAYVGGFPGDALNPIDAVFGNFNGDSYPKDLVLVNNLTAGDINDQTVVFYTENALGQLIPTSGYNTLNTPFPNSIAAGDFNGDGKLDLATISGNPDTAGLSIVLGNGTGTWTPFSVLAATGDWEGPAKIIVRDINGDGHPDIVAAIREFHNVPISYKLHVGSWLGLGGGLFAAPVEYNTTNDDQVGDSYTLAVADFDKDGRPDLIVTVGGDEGVLFFKGNGDGTFQDRVVVISKAQLQSAGVSSLNISAGAAADIDKDGKLDYVFASDTQVWWAKGNGNGTFQTPALIGSYSQSSYGAIKHVIVGDFDGDGRRDVAVAGQVFLQTSPGHFTLGQQIGWGSSTDMLAATDLNGDGRPDLVTTGPDANHIAVFYTTSGPATQAVITGGDNQTAVVNTQFAQQLQVKVVDAGGHGVPNVQVHFLAPAGFVPSATFNNYYPYTDNTGVATATATANSTVGCYDVTLSVAGVSTTPSFSLCNVAPDHMTITGGNSQTTQVSTAFASPLQVTVYDGSNNPKSGVVVKFSAPTSGPAAGLSSSSATTNASGVAQVNATANATAGSYSVVASAAGVAPVSFSLTNSAPPGAAAQLQLDILTSPQSTTINSSFLWPLKVRVLDGSNVPVSGAIVSYTAGTDPSTGASAALASGTATTDGSGYAQVTATANGLVGSYSVVVSVQGSATVQPKIISLRNYAPLPHSIALVSGTPQTTSVNTVFGQTLRVQLTDSNGNPTPQVRVYFTAPATGPGAALSAMSTLTDANGIAEVSATASGTAGDYQVGAFVFMTTVEHPIFVTFHLTNNAPQPTPEVAVPTMNEWGMIIFLLCAGAGAMYHMRRRRA